MESARSPHSFGARGDGISLLCPLLAPGTVTLENESEFQQLLRVPGTLWWEQLQCRSLLWAAFGSDPCLPSCHAEADGAYWALSDFPAQAHMVHPTLGQCPPLPAMDDGGCCCPCALGPHPHIHGDTDHCVRGLERDGRWTGGLAPGFRQEYLICLVMPCGRL